MATTKLIIILFILILSFEGLCQKKARDLFEDTKRSPKADPTIFIQKTEDDVDSMFEKYEEVSLEEVIEQGIRESHDQKIRRYQDKIFDIDWEDAHDTFWFPHIKFELQASGFKLFKGDNESQDTGFNSFGLSLGEYTVFNWGIDYLDYLNAKTTHKRSLKVNAEARMALRHELIIKYFELVTTKQYEKIYKEQLRHASFIYRLNRQKVGLKKVSKQEYYMSKSDYLRAQDNYHEAKINSEIADENIAFHLDKPHGTRFVVNQRLVYRKIYTKPREIFLFAEKNNPAVLAAISSIETSTRDYKKVLKENLPLPKITVNLGAYTHSFGQNINSTDYFTNSYNSDLELYATINATWTLLGTNGFLNVRKRERSFITKLISERTLLKAKRETNSSVRQLYRKVLHYQREITILTAKVSAVQKLFDLTLDNYVSNKARFLDYSHSLEDLSEGKMLLEKYKFEHVKNKVLLANTMGMDDFPGEKFEDLAKEAQK